MNFIQSPLVSIETVNYAPLGFAMLMLVFAGIFAWGLVDYLKGGKR